MSATPCWSGICRSEVSTTTSSSISCKQTATEWDRQCIFFTGCFLHKDFSHSTSLRANNILRNRLWGRLSPRLAWFSAENWLKYSYNGAPSETDNPNKSLWQQSCHSSMQTLLAWSESHLNNDKNSCTQSRFLLNLHQVCCSVATVPYAADIKLEVHRDSRNYRWLVCLCVFGQKKHKSCKFILGSKDVPAQDYLVSLFQRFVQSLCTNWQYFHLFEWPHMIEVTAASFLNLRTRYHLWTSKFWEQHLYKHTGWNNQSCFTCCQK